MGIANPLIPLPGLTVSPFHNSPNSFSSRHLWCAPTLPQLHPAAVREISTVRIICRSVLGILYIEMAWWKLDKVTFGFWVGLCFVLCRKACDIIYYQFLTGIENGILVSARRWQRLPLFSSLSVIMQVVRLWFSFPCRITTGSNATVGKCTSLHLCECQRLLRVWTILLYKVPAMAIEQHKGIINNVTLVTAAQMLNLFPVLNVLSCSDVRGMNAGAGTSAASPRRRRYECLL